MALHENVTQGFRATTHRLYNFILQSIYAIKCRSVDWNSSIANWVLVSSTQNGHINESMSVTSGSDAAGQMSALLHAPFALNSKHASDSDLESSLLKWQ